MIKNRLLFFTLGERLPNYLLSSRVSAQRFPNRTRLRKTVRSLRKTGITHGVYELIS